MKKLLIIMLSLGLAFGASAQRGHIGGGRVYYHSAPRVYVGVGYSPFYSPFYNPFYSPFYYPYYGFGYPFYGYPSSTYSNNSKLGLQIQDIQNDYKNRISNAKHDETLTHKERRAKVRQLKHDRDQEIIEAKRDYYNKSHTHLDNNQNSNSNQNSQNQEQSANPNQNFRSYQN